MTQAAVGVLGHQGLGGHVLDLPQSSEGIVDVLVVLGVDGEVAHRIVDERVVIRAVVVRISAGQLCGLLSVFFFSSPAAFGAATQEIATKIVAASTAESLPASH